MDIDFTKFPDLENTQKGLVVEYLFYVQAILNQIPVTSTAALGVKFDFMVKRNDNEFLRIQAKTASLQRIEDTKDPRFYVRSSTCPSSGKYLHSEIDYFAIFSVLTQNFYIIPVTIFPETIPAKLLIEYADGSPMERIAPYRNAWHLLKPIAPAVIVAPPIEIPSENPQVIETPMIQLEMPQI